MYRTKFEEDCNTALTKRYEALSRDAQRLLSTLDPALAFTRAVWQRDFYKAELLKIMIQYDDLKKWVERLEAS